MTKTVKVVDIKQVANRRLIDSKGHEVEYRKGIMAMIETVLHMSGNYKGFYYLHAKDVSDGNPGIRPDCDNRFDCTDSTRVHYY